MYIYIYVYKYIYISIYVYTYVYIWAPHVENPYIMGIPSQRILIQWAPT